MLKLYVWQNVLRDYTAGMAVALAHDADEARRLILAEIGHDFFADEFASDPIEVDTPAAFFVYVAAEHRSTRLEIAMGDGDEVDQLRRLVLDLWANLYSEISDSDYHPSLAEWAAAGGLADVAERAAAAYPERDPRS